MRQNARWQTISTTTVALLCLLTGCSVAPATAPASPSVNQTSAPGHNAVAGGNPAPAPNNSTANPPAGEPGNGTTTSPPPPAKLVRYTGPVEHIFFHPLLAFPERAFHGPMAKGYNDWFVTVPEFDKIIQSLYDRHFVLIDINSLFQLETVNGHTVIVQKPLWLPPGKRPLLLSVDDMNYYDYMIKYGNVRKLVVDASGNIGALCTGDDGRTYVSYDNEIVPILDSFVRQHPDFSLNGAKGMINLTGYEGVLGYRTNNPKAPDYQQEVAGAKQVIARLKEDGWTFACHGYYHLDDAGVSYQSFVADTQRWLREVEPLVGPTTVYVYPFGSRVPTGSDKWNYLIQSGFHVLCGVGPRTYVQWTPTALMMDRRHIDGIALHEEPADLQDLFDAKAVIDPVRPAVY